MTYKYEYAGFWLRFGAMIIDSLILCLAIIPAAWIFLSGRLRLSICYRLK